MQPIELGGIVMLLLAMIFAIWAYIYDKKRTEHK